MIIASAMLSLRLVAGTGLVVVLLVAAAPQVQDQPSDLLYRVQYRAETTVIDREGYRFLAARGTGTYRIIHEGTAEVALAPSGRRLIGHTNYPVRITVEASTSGVTTYKGRLDPEPCPNVSTSFPISGSNRVELWYYPQSASTGQPLLLLPRALLGPGFFLTGPFAPLPTSAVVLCPTAENLRFTGTAFANNTPLFDFDPAAERECCAGWIFDPAGETRTLRKTKSGWPAAGTGGDEVTSTVTLTVALLSPLPGSAPIETAPEAAPSPQGPLQSEPIQEETISAPLALEDVALLVVYLLQADDVPTDLRAIQVLLLSQLLLLPPEALPFFLYTFMLEDPELGSELLRILPEVLERLDELRSGQE